MPPNDTSSDPHPDLFDTLAELPPPDAALLMRAATPDNIAVFAQYIGMLGDVEDRVVDCFRSGGGVAYEHYPRFNEVMSEDSGQTVLGALDEHILPLVPDLEQRLAARYPNSQFVCNDLSAAALQQAREQAWESGLQNIIFEPRDLHVCLDVTGASFQYGAESAQRVLWPVEGVCEVR